MRVLDELDSKIIDALRKDGRASYRNLAIQVGISNVAVRDRINKLMKEGYIRGFYALVDSKMVGKNVSVLFEITSNPVDISRVANELSKCEEVTRIYEKAGNSQLIIHALFSDLKEMQEFIEGVLYKTDGISHVQSSLILKRYKYDPSLSV
ncbi:MAG: Lrp/AsnC family transcriptional regulator [Candidatus Methanomethylicia archaeon]|uniref:Lrp/AsnC family transcriptional regulator n=1 Tax=Candidatus Methanomethylicus mesodigestus TaxID=1867258 RepID=A0A7C3F083_9CREN|nr:Lrp/AsnC family transcriptional regulator [Candidatus Methanomethylicia archaeon]